jgi:hypothetical protein
MSSETKKYSRLELYNLVWKKPISLIIDEYLVSRSSFKRICEEYKIPVPGKGHWSKVKFNKKLSPTPLPECVDCSEKIKLFIRKEGDKRDLGMKSEFYNIKKEVENDSSLSLRVPKRLSKPDPITHNSLKILENSKKGKLNKRIRDENFIYYIPEVQENQKPRAFRILDSLFKAFRAKGYRFKFSKYHSIIIVNDMELRFRLREKHKRVIDSYIAGDPYHKLEPIGILIFSVERSLHSKEWSGSKTKPIEDKISTILAGIELFAKNEKEYQIQLEKGWAEQRERMEIEKAIQEKEEANLRKLQTLLDHSERWHKVNKFRQFLDHMENLNQKKKNPEQKGLIKWAREKADEMDPLIEK